MSSRPSTGCRQVRQKRQLRPVEARQLEIMIDKSQLRRMIEDVLTPLGLYSPAASDLLMGTAAQESRLGTYWYQIKGPALGIFQMEPATEKDIWENYLAYKLPLALKIKVMITENEGSFDLRYNLAYQIAMCRVHYLRCKEPLPKVGDIKGMAALWKLRYNTPAGKGTEAEFIENYKRYVL